MSSPTTLAPPAHIQERRRSRTGRAAPNRSRGSLGQFVGAFFFIGVAVVPGWVESAGKVPGDDVTVIRLGPKDGGARRDVVPAVRFACPLRGFEHFSSYSDAVDACIEYLERCRPDAGFLGTDDAPNHRDIRVWFDAGGKRTYLLIEPSAYLTDDWFTDFMIYDDPEKTE